MIDDLQYNCILFIVLLLFVFFGLYYFNNKINQPERFSTYFEKHSENPTYTTNIQPMNLDHTNLRHYKGQWNNSLTIPSSLPRRSDSERWWWNGYESNISKVTKENFDWKTYTCIYLDLREAGIDSREKAWDHWIKYGKNERRWIPTNCTDFLVDEYTNDPVQWDDLPWGTNDEVEKKNSDFSISFWIYMNQPHWWWEHIFRVVDHYHTDRAPGIWAWCCNMPNLHIRQASSKRQSDQTWWSDRNSGAGFGESRWNAEFRNLAIPLQRPAFCTIVFSGKEYRLFVNGVKLHVHRHRGIPNPLSKRDCNIIMFGFAAKRDSYALKDMNIYREPLSDDSALALYEQNKNNGDIEGAAHFFGRVVDGQCEAFTSRPLLEGGFGSLTKWFKREQLSTYEGFQNSVMLPEEIKHADGSNFNYYEYSVIKYSENRDVPPVEEDPISSPNMGSSMSMAENIPYTMLNKHEYNLPETKKLYFYEFNRDKKQYIDVKPIHFRKNGCTFAMWFFGDVHNWNWNRLFDFGLGTNNKNVILTYTHRNISAHIRGETNNHAEYNILNGAVNNWIHIAWTTSKDGKWDFYVNGSKIKSYNNKNIPASTTSEGDKIVLDKNYIGRSNWGHDPYFHGKIGDFRIFDQTLNDNQIKHIYENPKDPNEIE
jgi:hypothetical protein